MKYLLFLICVFAVAFAETSFADEKYLMIRRPSDVKSQRTDLVITPPNSFFVADKNGVLKPRLILPTDIVDIYGKGVYVNDFTTFQNALSGVQTKIILTSDIVVTSNLSIPADKTIVFNSYRLKESSDQTISFMGGVEAGRYQIFENWEIGDIKGSFHSSEVYPEWWGLIGSDSNNGQHDLAINAAIQSYRLDQIGNKVSLASGTYWVSKPLDLRGTHSHLSGSGCGVSSIQATNNWSPTTWEDCNTFNWAKTSGECNIVSTAANGSNMTINTGAGGTAEFIAGNYITITNSSLAAYNGVVKIVSVQSHNQATLEKTYAGNASGVAIPVTLDSIMEFGQKCHSSLIWIGGIGYDGTQTFHTGVSGVTIGCYNASRKWPLKRISGISWVGWVEETSIIKDIAVTGFSGFGIGGEHPSANINTVNGLTITNFNLAASVRRGAIPIFFSSHSNVHALRDGTLDMRVALASTQYANPPAAFPITWPQFGILAAGSHAVIDNVHIEGVGNGIHVYANSSPSSVSITNCDMIWGMEPKMKYYNDSSNRIFGPPSSLPSQEAEDPGLLIPTGGYPQSFYFHSGCLVSIGKSISQYQAANNFNSQVVCKNLRTLGYVKYVLRDWVYGIEITSWENERFPNQDGNAVTSYERGIPYGLATGSYPNKVNGAYYNKNAPATDKTYFTLIR